MHDINQCEILCEHYTHALSLKPSTYQALENAFLFVQKFAIIPRLIEQFIGLNMMKSMKENIVAFFENH